MKIEANIRCMILSFLTKCRLAYLGKGIASTHKKDQKVLNGQLSTIWHIAHLLGTRYRVQNNGSKIPVCPLFTEVNHNWHHLFCDPDYIFHTRGK